MKNRIEYPSICPGCEDNCGNSHTGVVARTVEFTTKEWNDDAFMDAFDQEPWHEIEIEAGRHPYIFKRFLDEDGSEGDQFWQCPCDEAGAHS